MNMDNSQAKIRALRAKMKEKGLEGYIVPKADEFQGEFVAPYAERLKWLTGFSGSAGVAIILMDNACVMSDGRYTLQLASQVDDTVFDVGDSINMGVHGWLNEYLADSTIIGYDPMLFTADQIARIENGAEQAVMKAVEGNLVDQIWDDQPEKPAGAVVTFDESIAGRSVKDKKAEISAAIQKQKAKACILTLPDSISWLLNVRGSDIDYIPSVLSYAVIYADDALPIHWITDEGKVGEDVLKNLNGQVEIAAFDVLEQLDDGPVMLDFASAPVWFKSSLTRQGVELKNVKDPCIAPKAIKSVSEGEAIKNAHIADGVALTKFLYWLDQKTPSGDVTEMDAEAQLLQFREEHPAFKGMSFPTIAGYGPNGAVVHYRSSEKTNTALSGGSLFLVDSGGQYYDGQNIAGTTDITRTIAIGDPSEEMIERFTQVLKGHIAVAAALFPEGTIGAQVDTLARQPLWASNLDFAHGTGHGVGCYLAVHEEAANISPRGKVAFEAGMLISNEPGYYKGGEYGIRIENLVYVRETGQLNSNEAPMLDFETVSFAPIDRNLIDAPSLTSAEAEWLNNYHALVFEKISPHLDDDLKDWLELQTRLLD